ncbi:MAG: hypothetical protein Q8O30_12780 [Candidatus Omnitrophota bacterium]|nr:hypothetical protein [Candidatus Omnitrophota bacterium]
MKAKNVLIVFAILAVFSFFAYGSVSSRNFGPAQENDTYYDLLVEYIGPMVQYPEGKARTLRFTLHTPMSNLAQEVPMAKFDDCHFQCVIRIKSGSYYFSQIDTGRYDGSDMSSMLVGDTFLVTVLQANRTKQLKDIRLYDLPTNPYPGPKAKTVFLQLTADGKIISEPQIQDSENP